MFHESQKKELPLNGRKIIVVHCRSESCLGSSSRTPACTNPFVKVVASLGVVSCCRLDLDRVRVSQDCDVQTVVHQIVDRNVSLAVVSLIPPLCARDGIVDDVQHNYPAAFAAVLIACLCVSLAWSATAITASLISFPQHFSIFLTCVNCGFHQCCEVFGLHTLLVSCIIHCRPSFTKLRRTPSKGCTSNVVVNVHWSSLLTLLMSARKPVFISVRALLGVLLKTVPAFVAHVHFSTVSASRCWLSRASTSALGSFCDFVLYC